MATSVYDQKYLTQDELARVEKYKQDYANAQTDAERKAAHDAAEAIRAVHSYSGGGDGGQYISNSKVQGLSPDTYNALDKYSSYSPSAGVLAAQNYLSEVQGSRPGPYVSRWDDKIMDLYDKITNREKFQYDLNSDMLYQQYKDQYTNLGQLAMMDTMGQAAGLTGGYANSYAQNVGQQAYQSYQQKLNDVVPELYSMAYDKYIQEGQDLYNQFGMTQDLEQTDYGRYRDTVSDYYNDLNFAASQLNAERSYDLDQFQMGQSYALNMANLEYGAYADERDYNYKVDSQNREYAYDTAMNILKTGGMPSADILAAAGLSEADARTLANYYAAMAGGGSGGSGGGGGRGSGYYGSDYDTDETPTPNPVAKNAKDSQILNIQTGGGKGYTDANGEVHGTNKILVNGYGYVTYNELMSLVNSGQVIETVSNGKHTYALNKQYKTRQTK